MPKAKMSTTVLVQPEMNKYICIFISEGFLK